MPLTRRQIYRRRRLAVFGVLALLIGLFGYSAGALLRPVPAAAATLESSDALTTSLVQQTTPVAWPGFGRGAIGAVGFDGVLSSSGEQTPFPIASITKTITSLVVLEAKPLAAGDQGPSITLTDADVGFYYDTIAENGSAAPVVAGSVFTQRQMLEALLLPSANNYSISLAVWAFGSVDAYLDAARAWLDARGLTGTTVTNTSGLGETNVSTPSDLVTIGKLVLADPVLSSIVKEPTAVLPAIGEVENTNALLGQYGVTGMKTGTDDASGACLLFSADLQVEGRTVTVVGVILGADDHTVLNEAVVSLLQSVPAGFHQVQLATAGQSVGSYSTAWDQAAKVVVASDASVLVWQDTPITVESRVRAIDAGAAGSTVGKLSYTVGAGAEGGAATIDVPLALDADVAPVTPWWRLTNP
ncbi:D-alanyl-D-alanine carboxypeptidase [Plantibacter flavus]|uniref:D-alanyl-D-alanine carboxypeptidase family protein n=1 Tax=Plantibacter flavus TaxID=150123 RepID=UPI0023799D0C|nr:D-alanyl-D-alanine carboxypeptidase [Plantibacter flavus]MDD9153128.1 D-alanyl-D-alanine carboxypeptidase [Plantibacter flavus]